MTAKAWHAGTAVGQQTFAFSTSCALHLWTPHLDRIVTVFKKPAGRLSPLFSSLTKIIYVELVEFSLSLSLPPPPPFLRCDRWSSGSLPTGVGRRGDFLRDTRHKEKNGQQKKIRNPRSFLQSTMHGIDGQKRQANHGVQSC